MTSFEYHSFAEDDSPEREAARLQLLRATFKPAAMDLIDSCPRLRLAPSSMEKVVQKYKIFRDDAKRLMDSYQENGHLMIIDRHKIAAALMMAILSEEPLRITGKDGATQEGENLANEILAFKTAVRVLGVFANRDARSGGKMIFPNTQDGKDYQHHAYRALHHARIVNKEKLNLPLLAHWMFYIEKYWHGQSVPLP